MKPRKHADIIKQWADGEDVEFYNPNWERWEFIKEPHFCKDLKYRVRSITSLSDQELLDAYKGPFTAAALRCVADAAIKRYIEETKKEK